MRGSLNTENPEEEAPVVTDETTEAEEALVKVEEALVRVEEEAPVKVKAGRVDCFAETASLGLVQVVRCERAASCFCLGEAFFVSTLMLNGFSCRCLIC